ncbi:MAG: AsmA-like C-terminal domain-containing protein [Desulfobacterales bacterium]
MVITPRLINLETVKKDIKNRYAANTGGEIEYRRINLAFFPRPHVVISAVNFTTPDHVSGTADSLKIYPRILPLFTGEIQIGAVHSSAPEITVRLPATPKEQSTSATPFSIETIGDRLNAAISTIPELKIPSIIVRVSNGRVNFLKGQERILGLHSVTARTHRTGNLIEFNVRCHSNLWESITIKGHYEAPGFKIESQITINHLRPHAVVAYFFPQSDLKMTNARADLTLDLQTDGPHHVQARVDGSIPFMHWRRGNKDLKIDAINFQGEFRLEDQAVSLSLTHLDLEDPRLSLAGRLGLNPEPPHIQLALEGRQINVPTARKIATALTENSETVSDIFEILRDGDIQHISLNVAGSNLAHMAEFENFVIRGNLAGGNIFIPDGQLNLEDVKGDATIANGILKGENVEARMGNSFGRQGKVAIALTEDTAPFHIEGLIQADLSQLPPVLTRLIEHKQFRNELALLKKVEGSAVGMLIIGEDIRDINVKVMASDIRLTADYERIPHTLIVKDGSLVLNGNRIELNNVNAGVGESNFTRLSSRFGWEKSPLLELSAKSAKIDLPQLHAWLLQDRAIADDLKNLSRVNGTVTLQNAKLSGPLFKPGQWRLNSKGSIQDLLVNSGLLPGDLKVPRGNFILEGDRLKITEWAADVGKSSLAGLTADLKWGANATLTANALKTVAVLDEIYPWLQSQETLKQHVANIQPLNGSLAFQNLKFNGPITGKTGNKISFSGDIERWHIRSAKFPTDIEVAGGELSWRGTRIDLQETSVRFGTSTINRLSLGKQWGKIPLLELHADSADIQIAEIYPWLVSFEALDKMFKGFNATRGKLALGGLALKGPADRSGTWQFQLAGDLQDLALESDHFKAPIYVNLAKFSAVDTPAGAGAHGRFDLIEAQLGWQDSQISLQGNAAFAADQLRLDLKLAADRLSWEQVDQITGLEKQPGSGEPLELLGSLAVELDHFTYDGFTWRPLHADISFNKDDTRVVVNEADLCGIRFPGILKVSADEFELHFNPVAENQNLEPSIACLSAKQNLADGTFNLTGELLSKAKPDAFPKSLTGNLELTAEQGRIYRFGMLAKIFALLNVTEIYRGEVPDLSGKGFAYNSITANGAFEDGKLMIEGTSIDSPSMGIAIEGYIDLIKKKVNLVVLVAPFKTVDRIVKKIPLVGTILGGSLISIPFRAIGDLGNPDVIPLSPTAVGSGLLGILERTIKLPVTIIQPVLPGSKDEKSQKQKQEK